MSGAPAFALGGGRELRPLREDDAAELYALIDANRAHLARWMQWAAGQTPQRTLAFIRDTHAQWHEGDGYQGAVLDCGRIVGVAGMHHVDWVNRSVELGWWLAADAQGAGIMTAAAAALVRLAFDDLRLHRVEICAAVDNHRSRALIERLGFAFEGVARGRYRIGDGWHDDAVYALLAPEHAARRGTAGAESAIDAPPARQRRGVPGGDGPAGGATLSAGERT